MAEIKRRRDYNRPFEEAEVDHNWDELDRRTKVNDEEYDTLEKVVGKVKEIEDDSGTGTYNGASPTTITVGGINANTQIAGKSYDELFQDLLVPYVAPSFSSFTIDKQANPIEVGETISGNKSFTFGFANSGNVQNNSISIIDVTNSNTVLVENKPKSSPQTADIGSITKLTPDSHTWRITAENTQGNTLQRTYTLNFGYRRYAGSMATNPTTGLQIRTALLSSSVINTGNTFNFQSGTTNKIFVVAVENGKKLVSVQNTTTNEDMTYGFVLSEITTIPDAAGNPVTSKVYVFQMAVPYSSNCNLSVTLTND